MFNHRMFLANIRDTYLEVSWGDSSSSRSLGLGSMIGMSYYSTSINAATKPCIVSSGSEDALCSRNLASMPRFSQQGHDVRMNEEHPEVFFHVTARFSCRSVSNHIPAIILCLGMRLQLTLPSSNCLISSM